MSIWRCFYFHVVGLLSFKDLNLQIKYDSDNSDILNFTFANFIIEHGYKSIPKYLEDLFTNERMLKEVMDKLKEL